MDKYVPPYEITEEMLELTSEIAEELGLLDKVREVGWAGLSAKETGRMGGLLTKKKKDLMAAEKRQKTDES